MRGGVSYNGNIYRLAEISVEQMDHLIFEDAMRPMPLVAVPAYVDRRGRVWPSPCGGCVIVDLDLPAAHGTARDFW